MKSVRERDYYTVAEVAELLDVSHSTVWRWIRAGKLPAFRVGSRNLRIRSRDLEATDALQHERPRQNLSIEEARHLARTQPSDQEITRRKKLFEEIMRTRANRSIAPMTSDELVRASREKESWYGFDE